MCVQPLSPSSLVSPTRMCIKVLLLIYREAHTGYNSGHLFLVGLMAEWIIYCLERPDGPNNIKKRKMYENQILLHKY